LVEFDEVELERCQWNGASVIRVELSVAGDDGRQC
jgi:hypothetical protein